MGEDFSRSHGQEELIVLNKKTNESVLKLIQTRKELSNFYRNNTMITNEILTRYLIDYLNWSINLLNSTQLYNTLNPDYSTEDFRKKIAETLQRNRILVESLLRNNYPSGTQSYIQEIIDEIQKVISADQNLKPELALDLLTEIAALKYAKDQLVPHENT